jgi:hypothetical protein
MIVEKPVGCLRAGGFAAMGTGMLSAVGVVTDTGGGDVFWLVVLALIALTLLPAGMAFAFTRSGTTVDVAGGTVTQWKRMWISLNEQTWPLQEFRTVTILREVPAGKIGKEMLPLYHLVLVGNLESVELMVSADHALVRARAEEVAQETRLELTERAFLPPWPAAAPH